MTFCVSFCVVMCLNSLIQFSFAFWIPACRASWLWAGVEVSVVGRKEAKLLDVSVGLKRILHAAWHVTHSSTAAWFPLIHVGIWIYCSVLCMYTSMLWDYNVLLKSIEGTRWKRRAEAEDLWLFFFLLHADSTTLLSLRAHNTAVTHFLCLLKCLFHWVADAYAVTWQWYAPRRDTLLIQLWNFALTARTCGKSGKTLRDLRAHPGLFEAHTPPKLPQLCDACTSFGES